MGFALTGQLFELLPIARKQLGKIGLKMLIYSLVRRYRHPALCSGRTVCRGRRMRRSDLAKYRPSLDIWLPASCLSPNTVHPWTYGYRHPASRQIPSIPGHNCAFYFGHPALRASLWLFHFATTGILSFVLRTRLSDNNSLLDRQIQRQVGDILQALAIHHHCQQIGSIVHTQ